MKTRKPQVRAKPSDLYLERTQGFWTRFEAYCGDRPPLKELEAWMLLLVAMAPEVPAAAYDRIEEHLAELLGKGKP